ncbi:MAG: phosphoribosylaminoimidazolesuccinocarboxamide synthase [Vicinamibacteraceae bacterium]|nr:phosphoribosylaminoimidazolesuccinocarboxamide synthase [Vicinamibacteraceae bacterium]
MTVPLLDTNLPGLPLFRRGKVRDVYDLGDRLLIVATDRISAFDYVLGSGIPDKGRILTQISAFWFERLAPIVQHHVLATKVADFPGELQPFASTLAGRSMLVRKTTALPVECVARGYLSGSGWKDYQRAGAVCGVTLPPGLRESDRLPHPIFTPATKAASGHDINISEEDAARQIGAALTSRLRDLTLALYEAGAAHAATCGILIADTKFEFGLTDPADPESVILIDEVLTPDSSRFWPRDQYAPGGPQPSYDKQFVRDYLERIAWNKQPPVPSLPGEVVERTRAKYLEAYERLTGRPLED